jgi:hypothetical protein
MTDSLAVNQQITTAPSRRSLVDMFFTPSSHLPPIATVRPFINLIGFPGLEADKTFHVRS